MLKTSVRSLIPNKVNEAIQNPDSNACYFLTRIDYMKLYNVLESDEYGDVKNIIVKYKPKPRKEKSLQKYDPRQPKQVKGSPYSIDYPVRKIDGISWIKEPTGYLCGQSCVAMLAAVSVDEVIKITGTDKGTGHTHIRKALNYYGIRYAPKTGDGSLRQGKTGDGSLS